MTNFFQIILLMVLSTTMYSQEPTPNLKNDIGINVNAILNKVIFKKVNNEITNPFPDQLSVLTYRHFISPKVAVRLGLGFDQFSRNDTVTSTFSNLLIEEDKFQFYAIHFGVQKNVVDAKKIKLSLGWDWFFRRELQDITRNDFFFNGGINLEETTFTNFYKENIVGFGIPMGVQYFINDYILISTEFSLEIFNKFSKQKAEFNGNREDEYRKNPNEVNVKLRPPFALFIHYRF